MKQILGTAMIIGATAMVLVSCDGVPGMHSGEGKAAARQLASEVERISQSYDYDLRLSAEDMSLFTSIFDGVRRNYVTEVDEVALVAAATEGLRVHVAENRMDDGQSAGEVAIQSMLASLDPYSAYLNEDAYRELNDDLSGQFGGLGVRITLEEGRLTVVTPIDDSPAARAGIITGDIITHANDISLEGLSLREAVKHLKGPVNSGVRLRIERNGDQVFDVEVIREIIRIQSVRWRVEDEVGYIRITNFDSKTVSLLGDAMQDLRNQLGNSLRGIVLDLRSNPGGALLAAVGVSDMFLRGGDVVVTKGRNAQQAFEADSGEIGEKYPVVVLINRGSASASEIVAGALSDHNRAVIIGESSFGKGSVQTVFPLNNAQGMKLTTARYYTPSGRSVEGGIAPDIEAIDDPDTEKDEVLDRALIQVIKLAGGPSVLWNGSAATQ